LDKLTFFPLDDDCAFGFVDPATILRACHLIPAMSMEKVWSLPKDKRMKRRAMPAIPPGISKLAQDKDDWNAYYVNR